MHLWILCCDIIFQQCIHSCIAVFLEVSASFLLTRASITYHTSVWIQEPGSRIQDPKDSVDSVDLYKSVRG
jgi:hypothetical protein